MISRFLSLLAMRKNSVSDGDAMWILTEPLVYESVTLGRVLTVPAGFKTDLASVPRVPILYTLAGGTSDEAAVVHDYLYTVKIVPRGTCDDVFKEASRVTGVPAWRRNLMWIGVRLFGGLHW